MREPRPRTSRLRKNFSRFVFVRQRIEIALSAEAVKSRLERTVCETGAAGVIVKPDATASVAQTRATASFMVTCH